AHRRRHRHRPGRRCRAGPGARRGPGGGRPRLRRLWPRLRVAGWVEDASSTPALPLSGTAAA
ncbi:hypothetical protein RZS08_63375, partial [Arthrospira platensis SPKY1]|nr:hypothetical protein [Arthrospira platensis SPKY1]